MSIVSILLRRLSPVVCLGVIVFMSVPLESYGQMMGRGRGNASIMDLSLQYDASRMKIACLGDPNEVHVKPGDVLVFRAKGSFVNNVSWDPDSVSFNKGNALNLANTNAKNTGDFAKGAAFAFHINRAIRDTTAYELQVTCGNKSDDPPRVIVDP